MVINTSRSSSSATTAASLGAVAGGRRAHAVRPRRAAALRRERGAQIVIDFDVGAASLVDYTGGSSFIPVIRA